MDWKQILSLTADELQSEDKKDEVFEELLVLQENKNIDNKSFKKLFRVAQVILKHKGEQVTSLLSELDNLATKQGEFEALGSEGVDHLNGEIANLKALVEKLEHERSQSKSRIKELTDENVYLQKKSHEHQFGSEGEDSPDALSEIDRQQELHNNINMKNKHIKRLLRDIEALEKQTSAQNDVINQLKINLTDATSTLNNLSTQNKESQYTIKDQQSIINSLNAKVVDLENQIQSTTQFEQQRELEIEHFGQEMEKRALLWRKRLDEKEKELEIIIEKYNNLLEQNPGYDIDAERTEIKKLSAMIKDRDNAIQELESKLLEITNEMIESTNAMNKLSDIREKSKKEVSSININCCENFKILLEKSNQRCKDYQEMLASIEEDNALKSKQAVEAMTALRSYESGKDGLPQALKKINELQHKLNSRDKQIRALIMEVNNANEVSLENTVLRKKLGIPDDESVSTNSMAAKHRKIEKLNDRLTLKLRASEEMRLQLKLEKMELRRQLNYLKQKLNIPETENPKSTINLDMPDSSLIFEEDSLKLDENLRSCEKCNNQYDYLEKRQCSNCIIIQKKNLCKNCIKLEKVVEIDQVSSNIQREYDVLEDNYKKVVEENENLRIGMHEILQKIREYDADSSHITIESSTLEKLLHALDARSISGWYHPAMRMQNELIATKEKELALREKIREKEIIITNIPPTDIQIDLPQEEPSSSDPKISITIDDDTKTIDDAKELDCNIKNLNDKISELQLENEKINDKNKELSIFKTQYNHLLSSIDKSDEEKSKIIAQQSQDLTHLQIEDLENKRKIKFLKEDHENFNHIIKDLQKENTNIKMNCKQKLIEKINKLSENQDLIRSLRETGEIHVNKIIESMKHDIHELKMERAQQTAKFFKSIDQLDNLNLLGNKFNDNIAIIEDDLHINYITKSELDNLNSRLKFIHNENESLQMKIKNMDDTINLLEDQLNSQKIMITKTTDVEISLRHLIADLQSNSNEKYLIAKTQRELEMVRTREESLKRENEEIKKGLDRRNDLIEQEPENDGDGVDVESDRNTLKLKYLTKILHDLHNKYSPFTPLIPLTNFVKTYAEINELSNKLQKESVRKIDTERESIYASIYDELQKNLKHKYDDVENRIEIVRYKTRCEFLEDKLELSDARVIKLQKENDEMKLREVELGQNWNAIKILFNGEEDKEEKQFVNKGTQQSIEFADTWTSTDDLPPENYRKSSSSETDSTILNLPQSPIRLPPTSAPVDQSYHQSSNIISQKTLESQLKQAMILASTRTTLLLETENRLAEAQGRIKAMERLIEEKDKAIKVIQSKSISDELNQRNDNIQSTTIASLQKLLIEKDSTLSRYQDLLKSERQEQMKAFEESQIEIRTLKEQIFELEKNNLTFENHIRQLEIDKSNMIIQEGEQIIKNDGQQAGAQVEINDNYIENMFLEEKNEFDYEEQKFEILSMENKLKEYEEEIARLHIQLRDVSNREKLWEKSLIDKDKEIRSLNKRLNENNFNFHHDMPGNDVNMREVDQLRDLLEEKDKHIQDLTETLSQFHDDQQKFINDTSLHSVEQVSQLSADLNRCEATNRILTTQIEALKRQIVSITQRENQARELIKTLKNQLIRRPVISVKPDRNVTTREENLQRKIQNLESELTNTKEELRRQSSLAETRKAKIDFDLWNKQKNWQQTSEKLKLKLKEKDNELEKIKSSFDSTKTIISRLEREKHILENRSRNSRYCTSTSCPNLHGQIVHEKYNKPSSSAGSASENELSQRDFGESQPEFVKALKSRIEAQQRRIVNMELEGKGTLAVTFELEKLQQMNSSLEAKNLRLEAKNLQLQLDNDMLKQNDDGERTKRQIKHLEDYVVVLKDELAQALSVNAMGSRVPSNSGPGRMEQTILTLKNVIDRLKVENKTLRDKKSPTYSKNNIVPKDEHEKLRSDYDHLQQKYAEALDQISSLKIETQLRKSSSSGEDNSTGSFVNELISVKEKLNQKTQLLEKAKILLTRAAVKEKHLREQIDFWKRKCSELQNVPVIDETSEGEVV